MQLNKRNTSIATFLICMQVFCLTANAAESIDSIVDFRREQLVTNEYSASTGLYNIEPESICEDAAVLTTVVELNAIADSVESIITEVEVEDTQVYDVPINTAPDLHSGDVLEGENITFDIEPLTVYLDAEFEGYEWDTRKRIRDIYILSELLVNQLNVSPTKAAAIIGNVCYEDSFAGLTNSCANLDNIQDAQNVLGNGGRGYGCVQWTASYRQKGLEEYYTLINSDLSWELTSVVAETAYLYNELYVSGVIGDLSEDGDLEDLTGRLGCEYEAYAKSSSEWYKQDGLYRTSGSPRYTYAKHVYELICEGV